MVSRYRLELMSLTSQTSPPRLLGTKGHHFIDDKIQKLMAKGLVKKVSPTPSKFSVRFSGPKKDGLSKLVINLRPLNQFIQVHFKMENLGMTRDLLREGNWMATIYLKDAYLSVTIWEDHQKYLRFPWQGNLYKFKCLPLASAVHPQLLKPIPAMQCSGIRE